ncbi:unnamed protein product [Eruca vesicaria subsp. sativa]|uniref:Uncharacterized protein n=1 Tax=Eruca vesicaria subsp. sativa TaxID=29727 RepID=A0ABC8M1H2_ERUVS|nr:unnamed protein product [Eruca vesicaria subsp. sativa]
MANLYTLLVDLKLGATPTRSIAEVLGDHECRGSIAEVVEGHECIRVVTSNGYGILLERIQRWVSSGVVGSPAFTAYKRGYDIYVGNFRCFVSKDHVNKNISSKNFWSYSINDHAREDIPTMIEKIHDIKTSELRVYQSNVEDVAHKEQPYKLCISLTA